MAERGTSPFRVTTEVSRRKFLKLSALGLAAAGAPAAFRGAQARLATTARIVIAGAGAGGLAMASRLSRLLDGAHITVIDRKEVHDYQPGFPLVAAGIWNTDKVVSRNSDFLPASVEWIKAMVAEYDPEANRVVTDGGQAVRYDYLVVAPGLQLDYRRIDGMDIGLIGENGIASVYAGHEAAANTWRAMRRFVERGGIGLFGRPPGDIKCAGAPLKITMLVDYRLREAGNRGRARLIYNADSQALFGVKPVNDKVTQLFAEREIAVNYDHELTTIDPGRKEATYRTASGPVTMRYDFIHVVPPMSAPDSLKQSPLAWQDGPFAAQGWLEVDQYSLRHRRYPNVFGVGDVNGVPRGKTAASVKLQTPVATQNLIDVIQDREPLARYNGYTSCPLITGIGQAMLVEFDYEGRLTPSFPFIDPLRPQWTPWLLEEFLLRPAYDAMLRGRA